MQLLLTFRKKLGVNNLKINLESDLKKCFLSVTDPRINRTKRHNLIDILVSTVCAVLSGADTWIDIVDWCEENIEWLKEYLDLPNDIPSHDTYARVFSIIDSEEFEKAFFSWTSLKVKEIAKKEIISIDEKQITGSKRSGVVQQRSVLMVSAWAHEYGISLGHISTRNQKSHGEKKTMESLIEKLNLTNKIVTLDANGATSKIFNKLSDKKADAVIGLKGNQAGMMKLAIHMFDLKNEKLIKSRETKDKGHGRKEKRIYEMISVNDCKGYGFDQKINECKNRFPSLCSFGKVTRTREVEGKTSTEEKYYFTTLSCINEFSDSVRHHWGIENNLHRTLDVVFREDLNRSRIGFSAENLGTVRRFAMELLKAEKKETRSLRRKRNLCNWRKEYLELVIFGETKGN